MYYILKEYREIGGCLNAMGKSCLIYLFFYFSKNMQNWKAHISENIEDIWMPEQHRRRSRPREHFYVTHNFLHLVVTCAHKLDQNGGKTRQNWIAYISENIEDI